MPSSIQPSPDCLKQRQPHLPSNCTFPSLNRRRSFAVAYEPVGLGQTCTGVTQRLSLEVFWQVRTFLKSGNKCKHAGGARRARTIVKTGQTHCARTKARTHTTTTGVTSALGKTKTQQGEKETLRRPKHQAF